jgi:hypothetical protein
MTKAEHSLNSRRGAHISWANTADPAARTKPGRDAFLARFERQVDPNNELPEAERMRRAEHLRKAHMQELAARSAQKRRQNSAAGKRGRAA